MNNHSKSNLPLIIGAGAVVGLLGTLLSPIALYLMFGTYDREQAVEMTTAETGYLVDSINEDGTPVDLTKDIEEGEIEKDRVFGVRVVSPTIWVGNGNFWWQGRYERTKELLKTNRRPVMAFWTNNAFDESRDGNVDPDQEGGQNNLTVKGDALRIKTKDDIEAALPIICAVMIEDEYAGRYLATYRGSKSLAQAVLQDVRGTSQTLLTQKFSPLFAEEAYAKKGAIFAEIEEEIRELYLREKGITILYWGCHYGFMYDEKNKIQEGIDKVYITELEIQRKELEEEAQRHRNQREINIKLTDQRVAEMTEQTTEARRMFVTREVLLNELDNIDATASGFSGVPPTQDWSGSHSAPDLLLNIGGAQESPEAPANTSSN